MICGRCGRFWHPKKTRKPHCSVALGPGGHECHGAMDMFTDPALPTVFRPPLVVLRVHSSSAGYLAAKLPVTSEGWNLKIVLRRAGGSFKRWGCHQLGSLLGLLQGGFGHKWMIFHSTNLCSRMFQTDSGGTGPDTVGRTTSTRKMGKAPHLKCDTKRGPCGASVLIPSFYS